MTPSAGITIFHIFHGRLLVLAALGLEELGMTLVAIKLLYMDGVREGYFSNSWILEDNVHSTGMAGDAVTTDTECL